MTGYVQRVNNLFQIVLLKEGENRAREMRVVG